MIERRVVQFGGGLGVIDSLAHRLISVQVRCGFDVGSILVRSAFDFYSIFSWVVFSDVFLPAQGGVSVMANNSVSAARNLRFITSIIPFCIPILVTPDGFQIALLRVQSTAHWLLPFPP